MTFRSVWALGIVLVVLGCIPPAKPTPKKKAEKAASVAAATGDPIPQTYSSGTQGGPASASERAEAASASDGKAAEAESAAAPEAPPPPTEDRCRRPLGAESGPSVGCEPQGATVDGEAERGRAFVEEVNAKLKDLWTRWARTEWIKATYIMHDAELLASEANEAVMAYTTEAIQKAATFDVSKLDPDTARALHLLKISLALPAPPDATKRETLAGIATRLGSTYGRGKYCVEGQACRDLGALSATVAAGNASYEAKLEAWKGWRTISPPMREDYTAFVRLGNEGAQAIGFADLGELWRSGYDMTPAELEAEVERLWTQVAPLYEKLHCFVRAKLSEHYGVDRVSPTGTLPAHLLGNMWAQEWANVYPLVVPYPDAPSIDVTAALRAKPYGEVEMVRLGEMFFTSLGLDKLPETFWERSMFVKPRDRDVVCHASAWDVTYDNDVRLKMCIKVDFEDLVTIHHELGHHYYYVYYHKLPVLFQTGAHDGFHEGIGDTLALSVTPEYLQQVGVLGEGVARTLEAVINLMLQSALDKIAFLPFGLLIDKWRWAVFSGEVKPENYNAAWWELRKKYQGITAPVERTEADFDPGAKYHIPANTPYLRYFLARILQFQFHRALCRISGHTGPLHECSIYGSKEAGERLSAMLALGASQPWPDALEALTGEREMDASALVDYYKPLIAWLDTANEGRTCGW